MEWKYSKLLFGISLLWLIVSSAAFSFSGSGSGTDSDPYIITTVEQLQEMENDLAACYELGNDIDASATAIWNGGDGFVPIGFRTPFIGVLDGKGHTIDGLLINRINEMHQGLFSVLDSAVITNVHLTNASVSFNMHGGTLAANANSSTVVIFCSSTGNVTLKSGSSIGRGGGLIGNVRTGSRVECCWADVEVTAGNRSQVGGLVGYLRGIDSGPIAVLMNSYSLGTVTGTGLKQGNLLGDTDGSQVYYCYSSGYGKALIGFKYRRPTIRNCYWDSTKGASLNSHGDSPRTTDQMMQQTTFVGWDFVDVWDIVEGETYPFLRPRSARAAVVREIAGSIALKTELLLDIEAAIVREQVAYDALGDLLESGDYGELRRSDIVKARQIIQSAMQHEQQSKEFLEQSIKKLRDALEALGRNARP